MEALRMTRAEAVRLFPDPSRVITKPFVPRDEPVPNGSSRLQVTLARILAMPHEEAARVLADTYVAFGPRHRDLDAVLDRHFEEVADRLDRLPSVSTPIPEDRRRLIGAYFTHEYSIEAAALGNPSIVPAPDQSGLASGELRFIMSLRAIGEGHRSSIEFRSGVVTAEADVRLDPTSPYVTTGVRAEHAYERAFFATKLAELTMLNEVEAAVLDQLGERFTMAELERAIDALDEAGIARSISMETTHVLHWLAASNYRTSFPVSMELSERVLFPSGPAESNGMEDARFVRFVDDDGTVRYYATYTAFDGHQILPQLIETADFAEFRIATMTGRAANNKGMALFPRRIGGQYVALGRHDNVNNYLLTSTDVRVWQESTIIQEPERPWELMQLGNCGSPIETDAGWLVITHGVGPFRRYMLGALMLDLDEPSRVIGHLREPMLGPIDEERDGYVPNVVYSCGSLVHAGHVVVPYGYADVGARIATIELDAVLDRLTGAG